MRDQRNPKRRNAPRQNLRDLLIVADIRPITTGSRGFLRIPKITFLFQDSRMGILKMLRILSVVTIMHVTSSPLANCSQQQVSF